MTQFPCHRISVSRSRREFLRRTSLGLGSLALASLHSTALGDNPLAQRQPPFPARAKRVILLFMEGGPSQMDTIDFKPELVRRHNETLPESAWPKAMRDGNGEKLSEFGTLLAPVAKFRRHGASGQWISDAIPHIAAHADDLCILNGMVCDSTEHGTATQQVHTGLPVLPRPSIGAWLLYGLAAR
jgi:hypothetical protein